MVTWIKTLGVIAMLLVLAAVGIVAILSAATVAYFLGAVAIGLGVIIFCFLLVRELFDWVRGHWGA